MPEVPTAVTTKDEIALEGIIDYAGLFPPADLDLQTVVKNWASYLQSEDSWMLARLIIPAVQLEEFVRCAKGLLPTPNEEMWQLSVLLPPASSDKFEDAVQKTIDFNLSEFSSNTILVPKIQELTSKDLFNCTLSIINKEKYLIY